MSSRCISLRKVCARSAAWALLALCASQVGGCFHYRVSSGQTHSARGSETLVPLFWGLYEESIDTEEVCQGNPVVDVETTGNLGYALITVATLGIVAPAHVEFRCAKDPTGVETNDDF